ncbi:MAG: DEAD/DEAH box helicase [Planctomycetaceae bacterium]|nr:DEAD/DEAH box helicase [Planctomycetaceae bacterium]
MDANTFIERLKKSEFFDWQIAHVEALPARPATFADVAGGLAPPVQAALTAAGIERLYAHQAQAISLVRQGRSVVIVTGTASGKTLCYNIPVVEAIAENPLMTALYIYPTKALTQDQLRSLGMFQGEGGVPLMCGTYDGDTPATLRRKLRDSGNIVLTNPDMLHQGILPHHARWNRFFAHLKYIVLDEVHAYRGVFGSHLANVLRRLQRICQHHGASPQFICCSATIANPAEHAGRICGRQMDLVDRDGSPRGPKRFVLWNPPPLETAARGQADSWRVGGDRKSPLWEAVHLMTALVSHGVQTITFARTRLQTELIFKNCRDLLRGRSPRLAKAVHAYRGGYLPEERREIERKLVSREILGVASTNALELGIDIGSLDACILSGYPGTIASLWQQAGRAGRGSDESLIFLVAHNAPVDQYLMMHSDYIFRKSPEQAVIDADNPHITIDHLKCAAFELPIPDDQIERFGPYSQVILELLEEQGQLKHIDGRWYWASTDYPAAQTNLRNISGCVYTIQVEPEGRVIGTLDEISALSQLHDHAVYLHAAETYFVNELDIEQKIARVEKRELDYYTQAVTASQIRIDEVELQEPWCGGGKKGYGDVTVTTTIPMFKKIRFQSRDSLGFEQLELPPQTLETVAMWVCPSPAALQALQQAGMVPGEALIGIANVLVEVAPIFVMCDTTDIGAVADSAPLGCEALFVHDRYPGGMGFAKKCLESIDQIMQTCYAVIKNCSCPDGCPSCVGSAVPPFAASDLDSSTRGRIPNKAAAKLLLEVMLGEFTAEIAEIAEEER